MTVLSIWANSKKKSIKSASVFFFLQFMLDLLISSLTYLSRICRTYIYMYRNINDNFFLGHTMCNFSPMIFVAILFITFFWLIWRFSFFFSIFCFNCIMKALLHPSCCLTFVLLLLLPVVRYPFHLPINKIKFEINFSFSYFLHCKYTSVDYL